MQNWTPMTRFAVLSAVVGAALLSYQNCSPMHQVGQENLASQDAASIAAFSATLFPVLRTNCASCHGASQSPLFAVADATAAHATVLGVSGLVNFSAPAMSRLVTKIQGGHSGIATSVATTIQTQISNWNTQLAANPPPPGPTPPPPGPTPPPPMNTATYASISLNILVPKCVGCHGVIAPKAGVRYDSYIETMKTVVPGNPNGNPTSGMSLYKTITANGAPLMPPGAPLTNTEISAINQWITNGAQNN